jgi:hypothetical protein
MTEDEFEILIAFFTHYKELKPVFDFFDTDGTD